MCKTTVKETKYMYAGIRLKRVAGTGDLFYTRNKPNSLGI
jgi:hypothetical protein